MYKEDLDQLRCDCGRIACEDPMFFRSKCHPGEPTWCKYFDGELIIRCSICKREVVRIKVAKKDVAG